MKSNRQATPADRQVAQQNPDLDWRQGINAEQFLQVLRNTGRIEQLEAKQAEQQAPQGEILQFFADLLQSSWPSGEPASGVSFPPGIKVIQLPVEGKWLESREVSGKVVIRIGAFGRHRSSISSRQTLSGYLGKLSKVQELFGNLVEDFDELARRIARCALIEEELRALENSLEGEETECLSWCVSVIRDVFDYNYAEDLNETHLAVLKTGIDLLCSKGDSCNKDDYQTLHKQLLETGLSLLPTSHKAAEKYKLEGTADGRDLPLFP